MQAMQQGGGSDDEAAQGRPKLTAKAGIGGAEQPAASEEENYEDDFGEDGPGLEESVSSAASASASASASANRPPRRKQSVSKDSDSGEDNFSPKSSSHSDDDRKNGASFKSDKSDSVAKAVPERTTAEVERQLEQDRLRPITDEISGEDSVVEEDVRDDSSPEEEQRPISMVETMGTSVAGSGDTAGGGLTTAAGDAAAGGRCEPSGNSLASHSGLGPADGAGGPDSLRGMSERESTRSETANKGLAGVGIASARASTELPGRDVQLESEERGGGASTSSGNAAARSQRSPERFLENSGQSLVSGRSGRGGSSPASEISEDFPSQFDNSGLVLEDGSRQGGPGSKLGDTLELSATCDGEEPSSAAAAAAAAAVAAAAGTSDVPGARASRAVAAAQQARDPSVSAGASKGDRAQSLQAQLDSLARSLTMLKDIRLKQQEYMNLLKNGLS